MLESQTLAFMYGDRPSGFQWVLAERAGDRFRDFLRVLVDRIFHVCPCLPVYGDIIARFVRYDNLVRADEDNLSDLSVVISPFAGRIVFYEHDLSV